MRDIVSTDLAAPGAPTGPRPRRRVGPAARCPVPRRASCVGARRGG